MLKSNGKMCASYNENALQRPLHVGCPNIGDKDKFIRYVEEIFDRKWLTNNGPLVQELESKIAEIHSVKNCVAICNGTIALELSIRALGLSGEVIVPAYTFIATAHALAWQGITPIFCDIDADTHNIDPLAVSKLITPKTTGIIGVHLWGRAAPVEALQRIADDYNIKVLFDAAHAFRCSHKKIMIGNFGSCEVLSFHATKSFNTFEGGAILTNDDVLADKLRLMRNFGFSGYDNVTHMGTNGKMIEIVAAMGLVNLESYDDVVAINRSNFQLYKEIFSGVDAVSLVKFDEDEHNNYQYVVIELDDSCSEKRDEIVFKLHEKQILARKYFWPGCHNMNIYRSSKRFLPNTQKVADRVIVLPTGRACSPEQIERITSTIIRAVE